MSQTHSEFLRANKEAPVAAGPWWPRFLRAHVAAGSRHTQGAGRQQAQEHGPGGSASSERGADAGTHPVPLPSLLHDAHGTGRQEMQMHASRICIDS